jgi:hypothetical protein
MRRGGLSSIPERLGRAIRAFRGADSTDERALSIARTREHKIAGGALCCWHMPCLVSAGGKTIADKKARATMKSRIPGHAVVAMYESQTGAEIAFNALRDAGLDVDGLTIVGRFSAEEQALGFRATGIPATKLVAYESDVKSGKFLVLAGGSAHVIGQVCALLGKTGPSRLTAHTA